MTLPVPFGGTGHIHPISQTIDEIVAIFGEMGFVVAEGPHIEEDFYNFTALNIPPEHPARQEHDTFYLPERPDGTRLVLRTHTSPVQIRTMLAQKPPIRIIVPGRTFRCDHDATHSPMFHQVEGLVIDRTTHMGHLKGCLIEFCRAFFGVDDLPVRFRPSYFPFTEPSAEVDIGCSRAGGELKIGAGGDWLEILGSGMVHPQVLKNCGIDPAEYQGFAFGMGIERVAMLKYGIPDLRTFYDSDLRWLRHYGFLPLDIPSLVRGPLWKAPGHEDHACLAQGASRNRRAARRDRRTPHYARPRSRRCREPRRRSRTVHRSRVGHFGRAAPECRPAPGLRRRYRVRPSVQVVCGAPNARAGMKGVFAPGRHGDPPHRRAVEGKRDPRRRLAGDVVLGLRARPRRGP